MGTRVVALDLDDTLYPEAEFVMSGLRAVSRRFARSEDAALRMFERMVELFRVNRRKVFDLLLAEPGMTDLFAPEVVGPLRCSAGRVVAEMVKCYRQHRPMINPYPDVADALERLVARGVHLALVTDGEAGMQMRKVEALGLGARFDLVVYTDSLGPGRRYWKPSTVPFQMVLAHFSVPPSAACYVGDNPNKDFRGPSDLGMATVRVIREEGLYSTIPTGPGVSFVVGSLLELLALPLFA